MYDLMLQTPFGLSALTCSIMAYLVGSLQDSVLRAAWWIPVVTATAASFVGVILYGVLGTVLGEDLVGWELLRIAVSHRAAQNWLTSEGRSDTNFARPGEQFVVSHTNPAPATGSTSRDASSTTRTSATVS
jgi:hypothetical protein